MFGPAGTMYVYMTYGMHWCCNVVTGRRGEGAAVLIRALAPRSGIGCMRDRRTVARPESARPVTDVDLCNGPAKLVQSLAISSTDNAHDLTNGSVPGIVLGSIGAAAQPPLDVEAVRVGTRIGISVAQELPWRLGIAGPWLSRPFPDVSAS